MFTIKSATLGAKILVAALFLNETVATTIRCARTGKCPVNGIVVGCKETKQILTNGTIATPGELAENLPKWVHVRGDSIHAGSYCDQDSCSDYIISLVKVLSFLQTEGTDDIREALKEWRNRIKPENRLNTIVNIVEAGKLASIRCQCIFPNSGIERCHQKKFIPTEGITMNSAATAEELMDSLPTWVHVGGIGADAGSYCDKPACYRYILARLKQGNPAVEEAIESHFKRNKARYMNRCDKFKSGKCKLTVTDKKGKTIEKRNTRKFIWEEKTGGTLKYRSTGRFYKNWKGDIVLEDVKVLKIDGTECEITMKNETKYKITGNAMEVADFLRWKLEATQVDDFQFMDIGRRRLLARRHKLLERIHGSRASKRRVLERLQGF